MSPAVKPRDAASLLLVKNQAGGPSVLMGRRPPASAFIPDAFVFPGGRVDPEDREVPCPFPLAPDTARALRSGVSMSAAAARALANAAIRETFEETGLLLARPADFRASRPGSWREFEERGLAPDHSALRLIGRAITPSASPVRYHARFFIADSATVRGEMRSNGELLDLAWYPIDEALRLPIIDVTRFMLEEARTAEGASDAVGGRQAKRRLFVHYRGEKAILDYEDLSSRLP
jgi:8-oxo-dGTP pyrophosphatase MutT (NUDIX family)